MKGQRDIASFVLRFTQDFWEDTQGDPRIEWRGSIRHVQSDEEHHFTDFTEAIAFIQQSLMKLTLESIQNNAPQKASALQRLSKSLEESTTVGSESATAAEAETSAAASTSTYQQKALQESFKLWEKFTARYTDLMLDAVQQATEQSIQQTEALKKQVERASTPMQPWWLMPPFVPAERDEPAPQPAEEAADSQTMLQMMAALQEQVAALSSKIDQMEDERKK